MSRLSIEVTPEQHQKIKALAALHGKSIKDFILNKLFHANKIRRFKRIISKLLNITFVFPNYYQPLAFS